MQLIGLKCVVWCIIHADFAGFRPDYDRLGDSAPHITIPVTPGPTHITSVHTNKVKYKFKNCE